MSTTITGSRWVKMWQQGNDSISDPDTLVQTLFLPERLTRPFCSQWKQLIQWSVVIQLVFLSFSISLPLETADTVICFWFSLSCCRCPSTTHFKHPIQSSVLIQLVYLSLSTTFPLETDDKWSVLIQLVFLSMSNTLPLQTADAVICFDSARLLVVV